MNRKRFHRGWEGGIEQHKPESSIGVRVDNGKLLDLNAYQVSLQAPEGTKVDTQAAAHGRQMFRTEGGASYAQFFL